MQYTLLILSVEVSYLTAVVVGERSGLWSLVSGGNNSESQTRLQQKSFATGK